MLKKKMVTTDVGGLFNLYDLTIHLVTGGGGAVWARLLELIGAYVHIAKTSLLINNYI